MAPACLHLAVLAMLVSTARGQKLLNYTTQLLNYTTAQQPVAMVHNMVGVRDGPILLGETFTFSCSVPRAANSTYRNVQIYKPEIPYFCDVWGKRTDCERVVNSLTWKQEMVDENGDSMDPDNWMAVAKMDAVMYSGPVDVENEIIPLSASENGQTSGLADSFRQRYTKTGTWTDIKVTVRDAQPEDSGIWTCRLNADQDDYTINKTKGHIASRQNVSIHVRQPVVSVDIFKGDDLPKWEFNDQWEIVTGDRIVVRRGDPERWGCRVEAGITAPRVYAFEVDRSGGRKQVQDWEREVGLFEDDVQLYNGGLWSSASWTYLVSIFTPDDKDMGKYNGRNLTCVAEIEGYKNVSRSIYFQTPEPWIPEIEIEWPTAGDGSDWSEVSNAHMAVSCFMTLVICVLFLTLQ